jgi:hypothetical protein
MATHQAIRKVSGEKALLRGKKKLSAISKKLTQLEIVYLPTDRIHPNIYNPNFLTETQMERLTLAIQEEGFTTPVLVNQDNEIVDGEHRWRVAQNLEIPEIPVIRVDMSPEQMRLSTLRHNKIRGEHNPELEGNIMRDFEELGLLDWAKNALIMDDEETSKLLAFNDEETWLPFDEEKTARPKREVVKGLYKVSVVFSGDEADIVRTVLQDSPADMILKLCRKEIGHETSTNKTA